MLVADPTGSGTGLHRDPTDERDLYVERLADPGMVPSVPGLGDWACYLGCGEFLGHDPSRGCVDPTLYALTTNVSIRAYQQSDTRTPKPLDSTYWLLAAATANTRRLLPTRRVGLHYLHNGIKKHARGLSIDRDHAVAYAADRLTNEHEPAVRLPEWARDLSIAGDADIAVARALRTLGGYWSMRPNDDAHRNLRKPDAHMRVQLAHVQRAALTQEPPAGDPARHPLTLAYADLIATIDAETGRTPDDYATVPDRLLDETLLVLWHISEPCRSGA